MSFPHHHTVNFGSPLVGSPLSSNNSEHVKNDVHEKEKREWESERKRLQSSALAKRVSQLENQLKSRDEQWLQHHKDNCVYLAKLQSTLEVEKQQVRELRELLQQRDATIKKLEGSKNGHSTFAEEKNLEIQNLQTEVGQLKLQNATQHSQQENDLREKHELAEKNKQLEDLTAQLMKTIKTLEVEKVQFETKLTEKIPNKNQMEQLENQIKQLTNQNKELEAEITTRNDLTQQNKSLKETITKLENAALHPPKNGAGKNQQNLEELQKQIKKLTIENGKLKIQKRASAKIPDTNSERHNQELKELQDRYEAEKNSADMFKKEAQQRRQEISELQLRLTRQQSEFEGLVELIEKKKNKIEFLKTQKVGKFEVSTLQKRLQEKTDEFSRLEADNARLMDQIKKSSDIISRLIEENSAMIDAQQFKMKLNASMANVESISLLINEKQSLCEKLHTKTVMLDQVISEKNDLAARLEKLEAQTTSSDILLRQISPKVIPTAPIIPVSSVKSPPEMRNSYSTQKIESISLQQKVSPKPEQQQNSTENNNTSVVSNSEKSDNNSVKTRNNSSEFEEVSLSTQFEIDNSLKPSDQLSIPKIEGKGSWLRGWGTIIWDVVTGRV